MESNKNHLNNGAETSTGNVTEKPKGIYNYLTTSIGSCSKHKKLYIFVGIFLAVIIAVTTFYFIVSEMEKEDLKSAKFEAETKLSKMTRENEDLKLQARKLWGMANRLESWEAYEHDALVKKYASVVNQLKAMKDSHINIANSFIYIMKRYILSHRELDALFPISPPVALIDKQTHLSKMDSTLEGKYEDLKVKYYAIVPYHPKISTIYLTTSTDGIFKWTSSDYFSTDQNEEAYTGSQGKSYTSGEFRNSRYLVGGADNQRSLYIDLGDKDNIPVIEDHSGIAGSVNPIVSNCFYKSESLGYCCDNEGHVLKYIITKTEILDGEGKGTDTYTYSCAGSNYHTYATPGGPYVVEEVFSSCISGEADRLLLGTQAGKFHVLDTQAGNTLLTSTQGVVVPILQLTKIHTNLIIAATGTSVSLYLTTNPAALPLPLEILNGLSLNYRAISSLNVGSGLFAVGGRGASNLGFVHLYYLSGVGGTPVKLRGIDDIPAAGCTITVIKEPKSGGIVYGGLSGCTNICIWAYALFDQHPTCFSFAHNISDILEL